MINYFVLISKVFFENQIGYFLEHFCEYYCLSIIVNINYFTAMNITVNIAIWAELLIWKI